MTKTLGKSILAGFFIAVGAAISSIAASSSTDFLAGRLIAASLFPIGLILIILAGGELFTGDCLLINTFSKKNKDIFNVTIFLVLVWYGNLLGSFFSALLFNWVGIPAINNYMVGAYFIKTANIKAALSPSTAIISGFLCNIFVCLAVLLATKAKTTIGKIISIVIPVFTFVFLGFEHCVADMFYFCMGGISYNYPECVSLSNVSVIYPAIDMISNLILITIGNIFGGFFIGLLLKSFYQSPHQEHEKEWYMGD